MAMTAPVPRIYIAASYSRKAECKRLADCLRKHGAVITSEWLDLPQNAKTQAQWAETDIECMNQARGILFFSETPESGYMTGGRHFELGWMARSGDKWLWIIGGTENVFHNLGRMRHYPNVIAWIREIIVPGMQSDRDTANLLLEVADIAWLGRSQLQVVP
jgi:hypothetical protein